MLMDEWANKRIGNYGMHIILLLNMPILKRQHVNEDKVVCTKDGEVKLKGTSWHRQICATCDCIGTKPLQDPSRLFLYVVDLNHLCVHVSIIGSFSFMSCNNASSS